MEKGKVSIIIVNWNGGDVFRNCLLSLKKISYPDWELVVIDNASSDGSERFPEELGIKNLTVINNESNVGFAPTNNLGYEKARGEYILLLNNDTEVAPDILESLTSRLSKEKDLGVIQPKIYLMDKPGYLDNCGSFLTKTGFLEHWGFFKKEAPEFNKEAYIFSAKGACMLIKREVIEKVGLFDSDFGSYFEESDFCFRVWLSGYKVLYSPKVSIKHKLAFTAKRQNPFEVTYDSYKNRLCSLLKNLEMKNLFTIITIHITILEILAFYYLTKLQFKKMWIIQKGIFWNLKNISRTIKKRERIQKLRKLSDEQIFPFIMKPFNSKVYLGYLKRLEEDFIERKDYSN